jgi:hypothetical protein
MESNKNNIPFDSPTPIFTPPKIRQQHGDEDYKNFPLPDCFGDSSRTIDRDYLRQQIESGDDLLIIPLKEISDLYFPDKKLSNLCNVKNTSTAAQNQLTGNNFFFLAIGTKRAFDAKLSIPSQQRDVNEKHFFISKSPLYSELFVEFLHALFNNNETDVLTKTFTRDDVLTIALFGRASHTNKNTGRTIYNDYLFGCATFVIDDEPSLLLNWLGVAKSVNIQKYRPKGITQQELNNFQLTFRCGTFFICICQIIRSIRFRKWVPVICQVYENESNGPLSFYKKQYFFQIPQSHELVYRQFYYRKKHIIQAKELIWMGLFHPLKYLLMFDINDNNNDDDVLRSIINRGRFFFLEPKPIFEFDQNGIEQKLSEVFSDTEDVKLISSEYIIMDKLKNEKGRYIPWVLKDHTTIIGGTESRKFGSVHVLNEVLQSERNGIFILDYTNGSIKPHDSQNFFITLSKVLFGNEVFYEMIRSFFAFFYRCLSELSSNHPIFIEYIPQLVTQIVERTYDTEESFRFGLSRILDRNTLPLESAQLNDPSTNAISTNYYKPLLKLFSDCFMRINFFGHERDMLLISTILNCEIIVLNYFTNDSKPPVQDYSRKWQINFSSTIIGDTYFEKFIQIKQADKKTLWITKISKCHYGVLSTNLLQPKKLQSFPNYAGKEYTLACRNLFTEDLTNISSSNLTEDSESFDYSVIKNLLVQDRSTEGVDGSYNKYVHQREDGDFKKLLPLEGGKLSITDSDFLKIGPMFDIHDFLEAQIDLNLVTPISRILDPWKILYDNNILPIQGLCCYRDLITFRDKTWIRDYAMIGFINWLNELQSYKNDFYCIGPALYNQIIGSRRAIDIFLKKTKLEKMGCLKFRKLLLILCTGNHYIFIEINRPIQKPVKSVTIEIADPINAGLESLQEDVIEKHLDLFIDALYPDFEIIYSTVSNNKLQANSYDCGIICLQRIFLWKKYGTVTIESNCEDHRIIANPKLFRLFVIAKIVEFYKEQLSPYVYYHPMQIKDNTVAEDVHTVLSVQQDNLNEYSLSLSEQYYTDLMELPETPTMMTGLDIVDQDDIENSDQNENVSNDSDATKKKIAKKSVSGKAFIIDEQGNENNDSEEDDSDDDKVIINLKRYDKHSVEDDDSNRSKQKNDSDDDDTKRSDTGDDDSNTETLTHQSGSYSNTQQSKFRSDNITKRRSNRLKENEYFAVADKLTNNKTSTPSEKTDEDKSTSEKEFDSDASEYRNDTIVDPTITIDAKHLGYGKKPLVARAQQLQARRSKRRLENEDETSEKPIRQRRRITQLEKAKKRNSATRASPSRQNPRNIPTSSPIITSNESFGERERRRNLKLMSIDQEVKRLASWNDLSADSVTIVDLYEQYPYYFVDKKLFNSPLEVRRDESRWTTKLYKPCQLNEERAQNEVKRLILEDLEYYIEKRNEYQNDLDLKKKRLKDPSLRPQYIIDAEKKVEDAKTQIILLQWELEWQPVFLPYDSIHAIRIKHRKDVSDEYSAMVQNPDGSFREKIIPRAWLIENLESEFFNAVNKTYRESGWVMFNEADNQLKQIKDDAGLYKLLADNNCPALYSYKPKSGDDRILCIRVALEFQQPYNKLRVDSMKWYVLTINGLRKARNKLIFSNVYTECPMDILKEALGATFMLLIGDAITYAYTSELNNPGHASAFPVFKFTDKPGVEFDGSRKRYIDLKDKKHPGTKMEEPSFQEKLCGYLSSRQYYYFDVSKVPTQYFINIDSTQISGLVWKPAENKFHGLERRIRGDGTLTCVPVELEEEWVVENINPMIVQTVQEKARMDQTKFIRIPVGNSRPVISTKDIKKNPVVEYTENGTDTCLFTSLSSVLHFMEYEDVAFQIDELKIDFMKNHYKDDFEIIMGVIVCFVQQKSYDYFRTNYDFRRIKSPITMNLISTCQQMQETMYHVVLRSDDGAQNHAVCIYKNWIFDGNFSNALPLSKESLDRCCDSNFVGIAQGYYYSRKLV